MNPIFPDDLEFKTADVESDTTVFELIAPFRYVSSFGLITVPSGFHTDGASVPRIFWNIFPPHGRYFKAAVIHDFLYSRRSGITDRLIADDIFKEAMYNIGVPWPTREIIYRAVRSFGWRFFKKEKP